MTITARVSSWLSSILAIAVAFLLTSIMNAAPADTKIYACVNNNSGTIHVVESVCVLREQRGSARLEHQRDQRHERDQRH